MNSDLLIHLRTITPAQTCRACRMALAAASRTTLMLIIFAVALTPTWSACIKQDSEPIVALATPVAIAHPKSRIVQVIPDNSEQNLRDAQAIARATIYAAAPGDELVVVTESDFAVVFSQLVPGERSDPDELAKCLDVPVGGASPHCQRVLYAQRELATWQAGAVRSIERISVKRTATGSGEGCSRASGWPYQRILQLLLGFQDGGETSNFLILGGDSEARGNDPVLPSSYVATVHIVAAPFTACGDPLNLVGWFGDAASLRFFAAERPASEFANFLFAGLEAKASAVAK